MKAAILIGICLAVFIVSFVVVHFTLLIVLKSINLHYTEGWLALPISVSVVMLMVAPMLMDATKQK